MRQHLSFREHFRRGNAASSRLPRYTDRRPEQSLLEADQTTQSYAISDDCGKIAPPQTKRPGSAPRHRQLTGHAVRDMRLRETSEG
jgi:hypothetical protein